MNKKLIKERFSFELAYTADTDPKFVHTVRVYDRKRDIGDKFCFLIELYRHTSAQLNWTEAQAIAVGMCAADGYLAKLKQDSKCAKRS